MGYRECRTLHLFAGAGGGILGDVLLGHRPICCVETNRHCRKVLRARQSDGCLPRFPIWDDVRTFEGGVWRGVVDVLAAGFPCQPYSSIGCRKGSNDERNLWPDTLRCIRQVAPPITFLENVPRLASFDYFGEILGQLGEIGYDAEWEVISASSMGAPHIRERLWILAWNPMLISTKEIGQICERAKSKPVGNDSRSIPGFGWWDTEPGLGRVAHGVAHRLERLSSIGNGQVPIVAAFAFLFLIHRAGLWKWYEGFDPWPVS